MVPPDPFAQLEALRTSRRPRPAFPGHALFRHLFVPALLVSAVSPWFLGSGPGAPSTLLIFVLGLWLAEQLYPARPEWNLRPLSEGWQGLGRLGHSLFYVFGVTQVTAWLVRTIDASLGPWFSEAHVALWPTSLPFAARALLAFLVAELGSYWAHRGAHRFRILWQFHSTHHVMTELNTLKALQTHPLDDALFHLLRLAPLWWLGAGPDELVAALYFGGVLGLLAHANLALAVGPWGWVLNLPAIHAVHHSSDPVESRSNYGCHTVLWDRLFGTFRSGATLPLEVGVRPVGPRSLWQELVWPLYRWVT